MADAPGSTLLTEHAARLAREQGWSDGLETLAPDEWERLLALLAEQAEAGEPLPQGWRESLTAFRDAARLQADRDDTRLAEQGEVFSREDDA